jgi:hypothetical protein
VLNGGVFSIEGLLANGVSATEKNVETSAGRSCFGNENSEKMAGVGKNEKCRIVVFQHRNNDEGLLAIGVWQREENERLLVFQQREKLLLMVFQQWKGKNETSAGRSCFGK